MKTIIENALNSSMSYKEYREYMSALLKQGLSTGQTQSEDLLHYSTLNETRMNRLDKTIEVPAGIKLGLEQLKKEYIMLVISEGWCGDAAQIVPVIHKMADMSKNIELRIALRDANPALMDEFLTNGARSIPKLVLIDKAAGRVFGSWGPRPHDAAELIRLDKEKHGHVTDEAKTELQKWYLHDKGVSTMQEIALLLGTADKME